MEYISAKEAAGQWGITVRRVQQYCKDGLLPGAAKMGNIWMLPKDAEPPALGKQAAEDGIPSSYRLTSSHPAMPLLNSSYPVGGCLDYINSLPDPDDRNIALGEYYFFSGQGEESARFTEPYLDSRDPSLRFSASLVNIFANLTCGQSQLARFAMDNLRGQVRLALGSDAPKEVHAAGIFTATAASVLLHLPLPQLPPLEAHLKYLPGGLRMYGCYVLAHKAYLEGDYSRCLTFADAGIALSMEQYPIAAIYSHIIAAVALMNLKRRKEAEERMAQAWELAAQDGLIQPFGEHHGLLQGLIEIYFKKDRPKEYERIIAITYAFSRTWREIHNPDTGHDVADNLTTMEFTIAMLYSRGWLGKEIGSHMNLSERRVREHLTSIYEKLGAKNRDEIRRSMLL